MRTVQAFAEGKAKAFALMYWLNGARPLIAHRSWREFSFVAGPGPVGEAAAWDEQLRAGATSRERSLAIAQTPFAPYPGSRAGPELRIDHGRP